MKQIYELKGKGRSMRGIAEELGISRNTVSKYVNSTEVPKPKPRAKRGSKRCLSVLPLGVYLREERKVGRDGYVAWDGSRYGVPWSWSGSIVQVGVDAGMVEIWSGEKRLAIHPRAHKRGQRLTLPGQWDGLVNSETRP